MLVLNESLFIDETEIEIIHLLCKKNTTKEIAMELNLTKRIVNSHLIDISDKIYKWKTSIIVANAIKYGINKPE